MQPGSRVAKGVQTFMAGIIRSLQVHRVLNAFEIVNFILHEGADSFPVSDRQR